MLMSERFLCLHPRSVLLTFHFAPVFSLPNAHQGMASKDGESHL